VLADAGIRVVLTGIRMPRMNAITERWIQTCRRELLDHTLIWNQRHLLHALREFERFYNGHRPHQGIENARPLRPLPTRITDPVRIARLNPDPRMSGRLIFLSDDLAFLVGVRDGGRAAWPACPASPGSSGRGRSG
jgi:hypothetical protein